MKMGKAGKWIKSFLIGKKEKKESGNLQDFSASTESPKTPITIPTTPKEKKRWSFRRSVITKDIVSLDSINVPITPPAFQANLEENQNDHNKVFIAVPAPMPSNSAEEVAAIKIQSMFRSYLARKALYALKGLVKLQALVRGYLVRKQAAVTFRCMQALLTVQAKAQAQRIQAAERTTPKLLQKKKSFHGRSWQDKHSKQEFDRGMEEKIKTVEVVDIGELRESSKARIKHSNLNDFERVYQSYPDQYSGHHVNSKLDRLYGDLSPAPATFTRMSPRTFSGYFEEYNFGVEQNSPLYYSAASKPGLRRTTDQVYHQPNCEDSSIMSHDFPLFPNYMANTKSFKAKARSQSAPKQRSDLFERQPSRRKPSNVARLIQMQRSTSHVGSTTAHAFEQFSWPIKLDRSTVSLKDSECGSTSSILTDTKYSRVMLPKYEMRNH